MFSSEVRKLLDTVPELIRKTFPIPGKFRSKLPSDIAELSRLLTNRRGDRALSYLARPNFLSAYLHYFMPWNIYRLCLLLPGLDIRLSSGDIITDFGSGPLTLASALWISRPDLRALPLEINCIDRSAPALEAGKKFFTALCAAAGESESSNWKINLIREDVDIRQVNVTRKRKKAALVCAVNIFNEIYESLPHSSTEGLRRTAANAAQIMHNEALPDASILTVEPGIPQGGKFISLLRSVFLELERPPLSPCPHSEECPLPAGAKKRWCHFAFDTDSAPKELHRLSSAAKLPKERLALSFLLAGAGKKKEFNRRVRTYDSAQRNTEDFEREGEKVRVISDAFPLTSGKFGRYGCSAQGLVLLTGSRSLIEEIEPLSLASSVLNVNGERDEKSGALITVIK